MTTDITGFYSMTGFIASVTVIDNILQTGASFRFRHLFSTHICDLLCQNPPLTHTMSKNSFHCQWITPSIN